MCVRFCMSMAWIVCFLDRAPTYDNVHLWVSGLTFLDDDLEFHLSTYLGSYLDLRDCLEKGIGTSCTTCMIHVACMHLLPKAKLYDNETTCAMFHARPSSSISELDPLMSARLCAGRSCTVTTLGRAAPP